MELTHPNAPEHFWHLLEAGVEVVREVLRGGTVKDLYELKGEGTSIRGIARELGISRNSVRKYLRSEGVPQPQGRPERPSKLDPYKEYIDGRLAEGLGNCVVLLRELKERGYGGGYSILKDYVRPYRRPRQPKATMRFETGPGEQAQVDWGSMPYVTGEGGRGRLWAFVMVLSCSRAIYVELVRRADSATFMRCHLNAFEYFGGVPRICLYDNAKVVVLGRDQDGRLEWNRGMLDFSRRVGFELRLCRPYRAQTKGKVESGIKYVRRNLWSSVHFTGDGDLNRQAMEWCDSVANVRVHGTTRERPRDLLAKERAHLLLLPDRSRLEPFLREERKVGRDGYVNFDGSWYGVPWPFAGKSVQAGTRPGMVEIWSGEERLALHPRAQRPGQRLTLPGQWDGLDTGDGRPRKEAVAVQVPVEQVQRRSLEVYELAGGLRFGGLGGRTMIPRAGTSLPGEPGLESLGWRAWAGEPGLESLGWRAWAGEPGLESLGWRAWAGEPGNETGRRGAGQQTGCRRQEAGVLPGTLGRPLGSRGVGPPGAVSAWPTCPSAAPWRTSTSPSSPPSTSGK